MTPSAPPRGPGQPTKLTAEVIEKICDAIRQGAFLIEAATLAGVHRQRAYEWLARGKEDLLAGEITIYSEFADLFLLAESELERDCRVRVLAGGKDWKAVAWFLQKRYPDRYGTHLTAKVEATPGTTVPLTVAAIDALFVEEFGHPGARDGSSPAGARPVEAPPLSLPAPLDR